MTLVAIISVILLGIGLMLLEFLVVPGVTVAGIGGLLLIAAGVYYGYAKFDTPTGHYILIATILAVVATTAVALKPKTWKRLSLNTELEGKVNTDTEESDIVVGQKGITISRLAPMGKVLIDGKFFEAKCLNQMLEENMEIEVLQIKGNQVVVDKVEQTNNQLESDQEQES